MTSGTGYDPNSILQQVIFLIKDDRTEGKVELPRRLLDNPTNGQIRSRLLTYPVAKGPINPKIRHSYVVESFVEYKNCLILIEKWKLAIEDSENDEKSASNGLNLKLFFQAMKSILHFSTITSLKSQNSDIKIKTREWSDNSFIESNFQFTSESKKLPPAYISPNATLLASVKTVPRNAAQKILDFLTDSYFPSECPTGKYPDIADGTFPAISCLPMSSRLPEDDYSTDDDRKFASISLDSGFMSDSKDNEDLDLTMFSSEDVFSPPSKQVRYNNENTNLSNDARKQQKQPTVRTLLTSPPIERQLKFIPVSTSVRLPFTFPTIRRNFFRPLLVNFEESILHERFPCVGILEGFNLDIGAIGSFCPTHLKNKLTVRYFSTVDDSPIASPSPYLGVFKIPKTRAYKRGYLIPNSGHVQLTLFNPEGTVVKIFSIPFDYSDMPPSSKTILRQRIMLACSKRLKYLVHLRISSSRSGKLYLHNEIRLVFTTVNPGHADSKTEEEVIILNECPSPKFSSQSVKTSQRVKSLSTSDAFDATSTQSNRSSGRSHRPFSLVSSQDF